MKTYYMDLADSPFNLIKSRKKTVEMRLNDERRKDIVVGDIIEFTNNVTKEKLSVVIKSIHKFDNFEELYQYYPKEKLGYEPDMEAKPSNMLIYYTQSQIERYGVLGITIELI